jgi:hypothetical protein
MLEFVESLSFIMYDDSARQTLGDEIDVLHEVDDCVVVAEAACGNASAATISAASSTNLNIFIFNSFKS